MENNGKTIIITGTTSGIGFKLANYLLDKNYTIIGCSRSESKIEHENYEHFALKIGEEKEMKEFFSQLKRRTVVPYCLINNAAIASLNSIISTPYITAQEIFNVNFLGAFFFLREAAKLMVRNGQGRIINFTTVAKPLEIELESVYSSSKAAIEQLTKVAAREFSELGITVNAIGPGPIDTNLLKGVEDERVNYVLKKQIIKRKTKFDDIANLIEFYLSENSSMITGQITYLGGV